MTAEQTAALAAVKSAKMQFDTDDIQFREQVARALETRMAPIRAAVKSAERAGVPASRIYYAVGYTQPAPYNSFMRNTLEPFLSDSDESTAAPTFTFEPTVDSVPASREFELKEHNVDFEMITYAVVGNPKVEADIFYNSGNHTFQSSKRRQDKTGITDAEVGIVDALGKNLIDNMYGADFTREYYEED